VKLELIFVEEKLKVALISFVTAAGLEEIDTAGRVVSIVQLNGAGAETLPAGSVAVTVKV